jgi:expansin (peptidoglycan-binding protein)
VNGNRWLSSSLLLAAVLVLTLTWHLSSGVACAATSSSGKATFYELRQLGNCSFRNVAVDDLYVALGPSEYGAAAACGGFLQVSGPKGSVRVKVVDQCPECERGELDLSRAAFARIADTSAGTVPVRYSAVADPAGAGPLSFRVKEGSSQFWFALLVDGHGNTLRSVEVRSGSGAWRTLDRADFNYWISETGAGTGPFQVRVRDTRGHTVLANGIKLQPGAIQRTTLEMYRPPAAAAPRPPATTQAPRTTAGATATVSPTRAPSPSERVAGVVAPVGSTSTATLDPRNQTPPSTC